MSDELPTPMEDAQNESPTKDWSSRFPLDQRIRKLGYKIKSRPDRGEATWEKKGVTFTQREVLLRERLGSKR